LWLVCVDDRWRLQGSDHKMNVGYRFRGVRVSECQSVRASRLGLV